MSFGGNQAHAFLTPLMGKTTTFIVEDRQANLHFAETVMALLERAGEACAIIDLDALYTSNSDRIFSRLDSTTPKATSIRVPEPGVDIETEFSTLFEVQQKVVIIDSLNSFHHLLALEDRTSRSRKLSFAIASLSYFARANDRAAILTMYRREGLAHGGTGRSISAMSDATASARVTGGALIVRSERGPIWPSGGLSIRIP